MPGYPREIFASLPEEKYLCTHCQLILKDPVQTYCGHRYCKGCVEDILSQPGRHSCVVCAEEFQDDPDNLITADQIFPDFAIKRELRRVNVKCINNGCEWSGMFKDHEVHVPECAYGVIVCIKSGCNQQILRSQLTEHLEHQCLMRVVQCHFCQHEITTKNLKLHHDNCPKVLKTCEFCGKENIPREKFAAHIDAERGDCKKRMCPCIYKLAGCKELVEVDKADQHIAKHHSQHLELVYRMLCGACANIEKLNEEIHTPARSGPTTEQQKTAQESESRVSKTPQQDREVIESLKEKVKAQDHDITVLHLALAEQDQRFFLQEKASYNGTLIWKISDFARRRQDAQSGRSLSLYSPCFYTSRHGYKMCARIYLNGDGMGKGNYISLFFVIMRGEFDAILRWPFRQKVTFILLDQNNHQHVTDAFRPDPKSSSFKRPTSDMNVASGCPMFVPLLQLDSSDHAYVKDDVMFIKVIVDVADLPNA